MKSRIILVILSLAFALPHGVFGQTTDLCQGKIRSDKSAAQDCANKAQTQGRSRNFSVSCLVEDVMQGFTDPNTGLNYYYNIPCTVNGFSGFAAELLVGWNSPSGVINPGWGNLSTEISNRQNPPVLNANDPLAPVRNTFALIKKYDPCTHQFFGSYPATPNSLTPLYSVADIRVLLSSTDGRAAAVPLWIKNIVQSAPQTSPILVSMRASGNTSSVVNNYAPTAQAVDVSATNVPSILLTPNYSPNCSNTTITSTVPAATTPISSSGQTGTQTQTPTQTPTQTRPSQTSVTVTLPTSTGTGSTNSTRTSGSSGTQPIANYITTIQNLLSSYRAQLQNITGTVSTNPVNTSYTSAISQNSIGSGLGSSFSIPNTCRELDRDLKKGDLGTDVVTLTDFLVKEGLLSSSRGTFDAEVEEAVILLQNRYWSEILAPAGLVSGTGFVGELTKKFINSKICPAAISTSTGTTSRINTSYTNNYFNNISNTTNGLGPVFTTNVKASMKVGDTWYIAITGLNPGEIAYLVGGKKVNGVYPQDRTPFTANNFGTIILTGTHGQDTLGEWRMTWYRANQATIATYDFFVQ